MSDYIKREDAIRQIVKTSAQNELDIPAIGTVIYILFEMDSADVRENVRGEWLYKPVSETTICSACGKVIFNHLEEGCVDASVYKFCPNCGADMRG